MGDAILGDSFRPVRDCFGSSTESGRPPAFFTYGVSSVSPLQADIEQRLAASEPEIEVLLAEVVGGRCLRVYIDHPDGVTLEMCERVTKEL